MKIYLSLFLLMVATLARAQVTTFPSNVTVQTIVRVSTNVTIGLCASNFSLQIDQLTNTGGLIINGRGVAESPFKVYGTERGDGTKYLTMLANGAAPGILTDGWITINGESGDPVPVSIAGQPEYMLGVNSDVGRSPTVVIKSANSPLIRGFDETDLRTFEIYSSGIGYFYTSVAIGNTYSGVTGTNAIGPTNGLAVKGNVGIGLMLPHTKLHINGPAGAASSGTTNLIYLEPDSSVGSQGKGVGIQIMAEPTANAVPSPAGRIYGMFDGNSFGTERLTIQSAVNGALTDTMTLQNGNVGVGITAPQYKLHVQSTVASGAHIALQSTAASSYPYITLIQPSTTWTIFNNGSSGNNSSLQFFDATKNATRVSISTNGDVGIGTTAPTSRLHIEGGDLFIGGSNHIQFSNGTVFAVSPTNNSIFFWNTNGTVPALIFADGATEGAGFQSGGGSILNAVTINSNVVNLATMVMRAIKLTNGAVNGYVLTSDANGFAAWAASAGGGIVATNANQFGASTTLTIKDGVLLTNAIFYGATFTNIDVTTLNVGNINLTNALGSNQVRLAITNLTDVSVPGRVTGDTLLWNATMFKYTNGTPAGGGFSVSGNSNQIPYLNVAGTGFLFNSHDKSAPGFGFQRSANGNIGAMLIHVDEDEDIGLVQIGPPNPASNISGFVPSLSITNRYAGDGQTTQEMVRVNFVDVDSGSSAESFIQTWRSWVSGTPPASTLVAEAAKLRKDGKLSLGFGLSIQGGATLTNVLYATTNINFPSVAAGAVFDAAVSVPAAADGDIVSIGASSVSINTTNGIFAAWASNAVVYIRCANNGLINPIDPAAGVFKIRVDRFQ